MRFLGVLLIFLATHLGNCAAYEAPSCPTVLKFIQENLPHCGELRNSDGFVYVDLDDGYIHRLIPLIQKDGFECPPYFGSKDLVGAHVTVIYPHEIEMFKVGNIQECGETIHFIPTGCLVVHPPRWEGIDEVYLVVIEAPQLDHIREKYGLPKREFDFHITIGVKYK